MAAPPRPCRAPAIRALPPVLPTNGVQAGIEPASTAGLKITLVDSARPGHRVHTCAPSGALPKGGAATVVSRGHHDCHVARHHARQGDARIDGARVWSICRGLAKPTICRRIAGQAGLDVRLVSVGGRDGTPGAAGSDVRRGGRARASPEGEVGLQVTAGSSDVPRAAKQGHHPCNG